MKRGWGCSRDCAESSEVGVTLAKHKTGSPIRCETTIISETRRLLCLLAISSCIPIASSMPEDRRLDANVIWNVVAWEMRIDWSVMGSGLTGRLHSCDICNAFSDMYIWYQVLSPGLTWDMETDQNLAWYQLDDYNYNCNLASIKFTRNSFISFLQYIFSTTRYSSSYDKFSKFDIIWNTGCTKFHKIKVNFSLPQITPEIILEIPQPTIQ